jgi:hypothetical protein
VLGRVETVSPFDGWDNEARTLVKLPPFSWSDFSASSDERNFPDVHLLGLSRVVGQDHRNYSTPSCS